VHLIEGYLDRPTLNALIDSVDGLVSLHRSEGFGLVIAEAMARGKLVIATGWSGNMDFMHEGNSVPVDYSMTELTSDIGPYRRGQRWAEPNLQAAASQLRRAVDDPGWRHRLGQQAREDVRAQLAPEVVARTMDARLRIISSRLPQAPTSNATAKH
jgi:glycosyltransferase involved in cell wall biosynthesis